MAQHGKHTRQGTQASLQVYGRHAKVEAPVLLSSRGKHGRAPQPTDVMVRSLPAFAAALVVVLAVSVVAPNFNNESRAYADLPRTSFPGLSDSWADSPVDGMENLAGLVQDGAYANEDALYRIADGDAAYAGRVEERNQFDESLWGGCEIVSLGMALESMGYTVDLNALVDEHLEIDGDFATGYAGDPRIAGGGFAPGIAKAANSYLAAQGSQHASHDLTGSPFESVMGLARMGYPVLVWSTMEMADPAFTGDKVDGYQWYANEHCVVVCGEQDGDVLVSDPIDGMVVRDRADFERIYDECGRMAVAIY